MHPVQIAHDLQLNRNGYTLVVWKGRKQTGALSTAPGHRATTGEQRWNQAVSLQPNGGDRPARLQLKEKDRVSGRAKNFYDARLRQMLVNVSQLPAGTKGGGA